MHEPILVYKHSTRCPLSAFAQREIQGLGPTLLVYTLIVQDTPELSHDVAQTLGVPHETPQAIILLGGNVREVFSHGRVTAEALQNAVQDLQVE